MNYYSIRARRRNRWRDRHRQVKSFGLSDKIREIVSRLDISSFARFSELANQVGDSELFRSALYEGFGGFPILIMRTLVKKPEPETPIACQGCDHYHGVSYDDDPLVCAMHPYGPDGEQCSDFASGLQA